MAPVLFRLTLLALGLGATEVGLGGAMVDGSFGDWALVGSGLVLIIAGSANFMVTLLGGGIRKAG